MYSVHNRLFVRQSALPSQGIPDKEEVISFLQSDTVQRALYFSSPLFYRQVRKFLSRENFDQKAENRIITTAYKYLIRMTQRSTPFALFSSVGITSEDEPSEKSGIIAKIEPVVFLSILKAFETSTVWRNQLKYATNKSLFERGDEKLFTSYQLLNKKRFFEIQAMESDPFLEWLLLFCQREKSLETIIKSFHSDYPEYSIREIEDFVVETIQGGLLTCAHFSATCDNNFDRFINHLSLNAKAELKNSSLYLAIQKSARLITDFNANNTSNCPIQLDVDLKKILAKLNIENNDKPVIQVCTYHKPGKPEVELNELGECINFITSLDKGNKEVQLKQFKEKFKARYGTKPISLLEATNPSIGIGFPASSTNTYTYVGKNTNSFNTKDPPQDIPLSTYEVNLLKIILKNQNKNSVIDLHDHKNTFKKTPPQSLQSTAYFMCKKTSDDTTFLKGIGGSCTLNTVARFSHLGQEFNHLLVDLHELEENVKPEGSILAEIAHIPDNRVSNVINRSNPRKHEIAYFSSNNENKKNIRLQDLLLVYSEGTSVLELRHSKTGQRILPRLSNAHNFSNSKDPIYGLLCSLQNEGTVSASGFHWGQLERFIKYTPPVFYKKIQIARACWRFGKPDYNNLSKPSDLSDWRSRHDLPRYIALAEGDKELNFDLEQKLSQTIFYESIRKKSSLRIYDNSETTASQASPKYSKEFIGFIFNHATRPAPHTFFEPSKTNLTSNPQRSFPIGSDWLYLKVYLDKSHTNELLSAISSLLSPLLNRGKLKKWFFIRYHDTDHHLRLRFHLSNPKNTLEVFTHIQPLLNQWRDKKIIKEITANTYDREIERYSYLGIENCEQIFYRCSQSTIDILAKSQNEKEVFFRSLRQVMYFLDKFGLTTDEKKLTFCDNMANFFSAEFGLAIKSNKFIVYSK